jgi:hypothetical protein
LRAVGPELPNTPAPDASPRLVVEQVSGGTGESLLDEHACGRQRASAAEPLVRGAPAELVEALKSVRLRPGVGLDAVQEIRGRIELDLPVHAQSVVASEPSAGQVLESAGAALEILARTPIGVAYRVRGAPGRLLRLRALDETGKAIPALASWRAALRGGGETGTLRHGAPIAALEAIFALERERAAYPFALASARPGTDGEALQVESSSFIRYSASQYDLEFGSLEAAAPDAASRFRALTTAGPFQIGLAALEREGILAPRLTVIAPDIPNLTYNATGLELALLRVRTREGREHAAHARALVAARHRFGDPVLEGEVELATDVSAASSDVKSLAGELLLRLPAGVDVIELDPLEPGRSASAGDVSVTLTELARDAFSLQIAGPLERFFSARAFGADGHELNARPEGIAASKDGEHILSFRVQGQPRRIAVQLGRDATARRYAFELAIPAPAG